MIYGDLFERENQFFDKVYKKDESEIIEWFNDLKCSKLEIDGLRTNQIDIGILLCFLELCLNKNNIKFDRTLYVEANVDNDKKLQIL